MKRIPLTKLRKILRRGDYVAAFLGQFNEVVEVDEYIFSYVTSDDRRLFRVAWGTTKDIGATSYYWLPSELINSPEIVDVIKKQRLKEYKA